MSAIKMRCKANSFIQSDLPIQASDRRKGHGASSKKGQFFF